MRETNPSLCKAVDIGRLENGMTVAGQIIEAQLIAHDEQNIAGVRILHGPYACIRNINRQWSGLQLSWLHMDVFLRFLLNDEFSSLVAWGNSCNSKC